MSTCTVSKALEQRLDDRIITVTPVSSVMTSCGSRKITIVPVGSITLPRPPSGGKRGAGGPIVTTSDEDDSGPDSPRSESHESRGAALSPELLHDHDYENISSPSSTASGPTYVRQPGFTHHAHAIQAAADAAAAAQNALSKPKVKKKKSSQHMSSQMLNYSKDPSSSPSSSPAVPSSTSGPSTTATPPLKKQEPIPPTKTKPKREPLPMRMRALPQSFWQQPNVPPNVSPAQNYPVLPPLFQRDEDDDSTTVAVAAAPPPPPEARPVSPIEEKASTSKPQKVPDRKITVANTDLLFKLFETLEKKPSGSSSQQSSLQHGSLSHQHHHIKRRPKKVSSLGMKPLLSGDDPYLGSSASEKLFPQLSMDLNGSNNSGPQASMSSCSSSSASAASTAAGPSRGMLHLVTLHGGSDGDKAVTLPSLSIEHNYSQMLSELVTHI